MRASAAAVAVAAEAEAAMHFLVPPLFRLCSRHLFFFVVYEVFSLSGIFFYYRAHHVIGSVSAVKGLYDQTVSLCVREFIQGHKKTAGNSTAQGSPFLRACWSQAGIILVPPPPNFFLTGNSSGKLFSVTNEGSQQGPTLLGGGGGGHFD